MVSFPTQPCQMELIGIARAQIIIVWAVKGSIRLLIIGVSDGAVLVTIIIVAMRAVFANQVYPLSMVYDMATKEDELLHEFSY